MGVKRKREGKGKEMKNRGRLGGNEEETGRMGRGRELEGEWREE